LWLNQEFFIYLFQALAAICYFISWKSYKPVREKSLDFIGDTGGQENSPYVCRTDVVRSPDLTLTTELSDSCSSLKTGDSRNLLDTRILETADTNE